MPVYRVEVDEPGCSTCQHERTFHVIGPGEVASAVSYEDAENAEYLRDECNRAYELGRAAGITEGIAQAGQDPWTPFAEDSMPPNGSALIVWDTEFRSINSFYYVAEVDSLEKIRGLHYSHYMLASAFAGPRNPSTQPPPVLAPAADPPPPNAPILPGAPGDSFWDDDIPF